MNDLPCPRCGGPAPQDYYGPCEQCIADLRKKFDRQ